MASIEMFRSDPAAQPLAAGQILFEEGQPGETMFVVTEGEVDLTVHGRSIEVVGPGGIFGEMVLVDRKARSATARAKTPAKVVPISQRRFLYLVQSTPFFAIEVMSIMAERLRRMNEAV
jgi:CRP-like cAMP-binding protein